MKKTPRKVKEADVQKIYSFIKTEKNLQKYMIFLVTEGIMNPVKGLQKLYDELDPPQQGDAIGRVTSFLQKKEFGDHINISRVGKKKTYSYKETKEIVNEIGDDEIRPIGVNKNVIRNEEPIESNDSLELVKKVLDFFKNPGNYNLGQTKKLMEQVEEELKPRLVIEAIIETWQKEQQNQMISLKEKFGI